MVKDQSGWMVARKKRQQQKQDVKFKNSERLEPLPTSSRDRSEQSNSDIRSRRRHQAPDYVKCSRHFELRDQVGPQTVF
jgi:hypothetical protein